MKKVLLTFLVVLSTTLFSQNITVLQINADWNSNNTMIGLDRLKGCTYKYGDLEKQPTQIKNSISSVPTILLLVDGKPKKQWVAGIDLRISATREDIQAEINKYIK
jgi:hypothetical protein